MSLLTTVAGFRESQFSPLSQEVESGGDNLPGLGLCYLLPDPDMPLLDEDTGVVDRLGESQLEHLQRRGSRDNKKHVHELQSRVYDLSTVYKPDLRLQPALQEVLDLEAEHVVELHTVVSEDTGPNQPPAGREVKFLECHNLVLIKRAK